MKRFTLFLAICMGFFACKEKSENYASFGEKISTENVLTAQQMHHQYETLKPGDTLEVSFKANVNEVCKKKGCWMKLGLDNEVSSFVKFKDYAFFVPLDADHHTVIVKGKAFVTETSVNDLRHFAKDGGKTEEEIAAIITPKREFAFMADGVLMEE
ncbi:DUF4920 domain-containing protein [Zhouia sp. PK063]|uniref:DUF4920 domain-containing protein n=1 Tax=Zhouia sp. PK063 TaxID=3373602 RepID=UPI00379521CB